ncbi:hypothetical protein F5Y11DRAFT_351593 [Daldinia sp. FL1419]|nr:hypothetical protein F5Y11DRAFT_351593 [Daldinia sp. FL1419]
MAATHPAPESDKCNGQQSDNCSAKQNQEGIKRRQREAQGRSLARRYRDLPYGSRLGLHWDFTREKMVPYIKDHFTGVIRPAIMKDGMYDNMSKEKLERHRQKYLQMIEASKNKHKEDKSQETPK